MLFRHAAPPATPACGRVRSERGETLIEVLVMIVLMGIGFTAIFSGLMTVSRINDANARRTKASIAVQGWAEGLQQPARKLTGSAADPYTYIECASAATYGSTGQPSGLLPSTWNAQSMNKVPVLVEYFTGTFNSNGEPQFDTNQAACFGARKDQGLQRITIKVETPPGDLPRVVDTLVFIKRNQRCPDVAGFDNADLGPC